MDSFLSYTIDSSEIQRLEKMYYEEKNRNNNTNQIEIKFEYACALIRSKYLIDINKGIILLKELCENGNKEYKRDYLYFFIVSNLKLGEYQTALQCCNVFLETEPENRQILELKKYIKDKLVKEGLKGIAITGGVVASIVAIVASVGFALSKN